MIEDILKHTTVDANIYRDRINKFYKLVKQYNDTHNITRITDYESFLLKHVIDSIYPMIKFFDYTKKGGLKVCDLGTGGGFPTIPLILLNNKNTFYSVDSKAKKINFLKRTKLFFNLDNLMPINERIEKLSKHNFEKFDLITLRAVKVSSNLIETMFDLLAEKGVVCIYTTSDANNKQNLLDISKNINSRSFNKVCFFNYILPKSNTERGFLMCTK